MRSAPQHDLATLARTLGDPTRLTMLAALLTHDELAAGELAALAKVTPQTASAHLKRLYQAGFVTWKMCVRCRVYALAGSQVREAVEALLTLSSSPLSAAKASGSLSSVRCCYDHLGGTVGVTLLDTLLARRWLEPVGSSVSWDYRLSEVGTRKLLAFGLDVFALARDRRRYFARKCFDKTEKRSHLAGSIGSALFGQLLVRGWLEQTGEGRAIRVTPTGWEGLEATFGLVQPY